MAGPESWRCSLPARRTAALFIEALRRRSGGTFDMPEGTVYPALRRLEREGLLKSRWAEESGRRRRVYDLTERGRAALAAQQSEWGRFARGVESVLEEARPAETSLEALWRDRE